MGEPPVEDVTHDHGHLTRLVFEVRDLTQALRETPRDPEVRTALADALDALQDDLATHFAKEEEGLFPFVVARVPTFAPRTEKLASLHDALCGAISRLARSLGDESVELGVSAEKDDRLIFAGFERFQVAYAEHAHEERELLEELPRLLNKDDLAALRVLLAEL